MTRYPNNEQRGDQHIDRQPDGGDYTPCKVTGDGTEVAELAPVRDLTRDDATNYALQAYGEDAGIVDGTGHVVWVGDIALATRGD